VVKGTPKPLKKKRGPGNLKKRNPTKRFKVELTPGWVD